MNNKFMLVPALLALLLAACGPAAAVAGSEAAVKIANFAFDPVTLTVKVGTTVKWTNQDAAAHTVTADDNSWGSGNLNTGDSFTFTFTQAGTFNYHCGVHPTMKATITVTP